MVLRRADRVPLSLNFVERRLHGERISYAPVMADTRTIRGSVAPVAHDCVQIVVVRDGSAILCSDFGQKPATVGDVILLASDVPCGFEAEGRLTTTTIYADTDYVLDQVFWQFVGFMSHRIDAREFAANIYDEHAQVLRIGEARVRSLAPWLDELVAMSGTLAPEQEFFRRQALWFSIAHVIAPFIRTSPVRIARPEPTTSWPSLPRIRWFGPLRREARTMAALL